MRIFVQEPVKELELPSKRSPELGEELELPSKRSPEAGEALELPSKRSPELGEALELPSKRSPELGEAPHPSQQPLYTGSLLFRPWQLLNERPIVRQAHFQCCQILQDQGLEHPQKTQLRLLLERLRYRIRLNQIRNWLDCRVGGAQVEYSTLFRGHACV